MSDYLNTLDFGMGSGVGMDLETQKNLRIAGGWSLFFAVLGFMGTLSIFSTAVAILAFENLDALVWWYVIFSAAGAYVSYSWLQFGLNARKVGKDGGTQEVKRAIKSLRVSLTATGIMMILSLAACVISLAAFTLMGF